LIPTDTQQVNSAIVYGQLARAGYRGRAITLPSWRLIPGQEYRNAATGFHAKVFQNRVTGEVVLSFAGTDDANDAKQDVKQGAGKLTEQYTTAVNLAGQLKRRYGKRLTLVGHSLGGGLAAAAAIVNSIPAWTFNPASVHPNTVGGYKNLRRARRFVNAFFLEGEFLHITEGLMGVPSINYGNAFVIPDLLGTNIINGHFMDNVIASLQAHLTTLNSPSIVDRINNLNNTQNNRLQRQLYDELGLYK